MPSKPVVIQHPLRTIRMEYKSDRPLSSLEQEALQRYLQLHDELLSINQEWEQIGWAWQALENPQQALEIQLAALEQELRPYKHLAGFSKKEVDQMIDLPESYQLNVEELMQTGAALKQRFDKHYNAITQLSSSHGDLEKRAEEFEDNYDEFNDRFVKRITATEEMEISGTQFHCDFNAFNHCINMGADKRKQTIALRYNIISAYNPLVKGIDKAFKRINQVGEEIAMMHPAHVPDRQPGLN